MQVKDEIAVGSDGMLFHRFDWAFEQVCGDMPFPASQQARWISLLNARQTFCAALGARFLTLVVPERHAVYPERLPGERRPNPGRPVLRLARASCGEGGSGLIYPLEALRATSRFEQTFHLTDQHMTDAGAYACYRALIDHCPEAFHGAPLSPSALTRSESRLVGDLGIRLDDETDEPVDHLQITRPQAAKIAGARLQAGRIDVYEQADTGLPKAVWFGDSHSFSLLPFIAEHFSRLVAVQSSRLLTDLVEFETPDLVVCQTSETQIAYPAAPDRLDIVRLPQDGGTDGLAELYAAGGLSRPASYAIKVEFGIEGNAHHFCIDGWSAPEPTQRWSMGARSTLRLPVPPAGRNWSLRIQAHPFLVATRHERQRLAVVCHQRTLAAFDLTGELSASIDLPGETLAAAARDGHVLIEFLHPDAASPSQFGGQDPRCLALCFRSLTVQG
ncbi:alginate O-acetyltransferase AlgX-related protein [Endobacter medicaginis]